jgi:hypothetical protein
VSHHELQAALNSSIGDSSASGANVAPHKHQPSGFSTYTASGLGLVVKSMSGLPKHYMIANSTKKPLAKRCPAEALPLTVSDGRSAKNEPLHLYRKPIYDMDSLQYMGNALLMEERDPVRLHDRVYSELRKAVPPNQLEQLLGNEVGAPADQNYSRRERATNPYDFAEFLPLFAIRPLYNETLYVVSKTGLGLVRAGVAISVGSYYLLGVVLFLWVRAHAIPLRSAILCTLGMLSPPLTALGRDTTSDALASLVAFVSLYLIFERRCLGLGTVILLSSLFFRTDFVVLAVPVIFLFWLERRIPLWQAAVLALVAVSSVLAINHFAGDYGIRMLYYRNFVGTPAAPAEMTVHFSAHDYLSAFRSGITKVADSFFLPFLLLGATGLQCRAGRLLLGTTLAYVTLHFLVLPNWQERWVAVFYLSAIVCLALMRQFTAAAPLIESRSEVAA